MRKHFLFFLLVLAFTFQVWSQPSKSYTSSELLLGLKKLSVLGSVLYVAAHPDDENTRFITYLSKERLVNTAYLSLTRGDGGQNLVGPEIREELGIIRTQELLAARKVDGGKQFFSRANDFGYSKHPDETFNIWDRDQVLADVVWTIRKFKPDVIITRFSPRSAGKTHGHHTASAIIANEAFELAGKDDAYPEQLKHVEPWQPKRVFYNGSWWSFKYDTTLKREDFMQLDVGTYNPLLGKSYGEISAESRTMHKSQGFGTTGERGEAIEYIYQTKGEPINRDILEKVDMSWNRIEGGKVVGDFIDRAIQSFDAENPSSVIPLLLKAKTELKKLPKSHYKKIKMQELKEVIRGCLGLYIEAKSDKDYIYSPGDSLNISVELVNRSSIPVNVKSIKYPYAQKVDYDTILTNNKRINLYGQSVVEKDEKYSQPYWLIEKSTKGMFVVNNQRKIGMAQNKPSLTAKLKISIEGEEINFTLPIIHRWNDPVKGEVKVPTYIAPPVFVNLPDDVYIFDALKAKKVPVIIRAGRDKVNGKVSLDLPNGWKVSPAEVKVSLPKKEDVQQYTFEVTPPEGQSVAEMKAKIILDDGKSYDWSFKEIAYDHIPQQLILPKANAKAVKLSLEKKGEKVAYVMGAGDRMPESLEAIGYQVTILDHEDLKFETLKNYDAVILGIRIYNKSPQVKTYEKDLFKYVEEGGTLIVQYNSSWGHSVKDIAPFFLQLSRDRVTVEEAEVRILAPEHPIMTTPNKITVKDFEGWVQERGLYFANEWGEQFTPILSSNDPGESPKDGGLLVAKHGKGYYIYTGYSWFRELPAGVPGAYRIFANMVSIGK